MRKIGLLFLSFIILFGQDYQKDFFVSGEFNLSSINKDVILDDKSYKPEYLTTQNLLAHIEIGYAFFNNFAAGLSVKFVGVGYFTKISTRDGGHLEVAWGPFVRYYLWREKIAPFAQITANYSNSELNGKKSMKSFEDLFHPNIYSTYQYSVSLGSDYFVTEYVSFIAQASYSLGEVNYRAVSPEYRYGSTKYLGGKDLVEEFYEFSVTLGLSLHF